MPKETVLQELGLRFTEEAAEKTKRKMAYLKEHEKEIPPGTVTIHVKKGDDFLSTASRTGSNLVWYSDEPKERGGQSKGTSPLSYLLSSMGMCQMVHYAEHSMVEGLRIDSLEMKIEGKISFQRPRRFLNILYETRISSPEGDDTIKKLAMQAVEDCYVTNTLKRGCDLAGVIFHNGSKIDEHH